jgi:undecaprenyl diphosphate synthase
MELTTAGEEAQALVAGGPLPRHIAIIMDGNGRWARRRGLPRVAGHRAAVEAVREVVRACGELGIEVLTLYAFSTENWRRPADEVQALMGLFVDVVRRELDSLVNNGVRVRVIGRRGELPPDVQAAVGEAEERTRHNSGLLLVLALNYGGRQDVVDAVRALAREVAEGRLAPGDIDERRIEAHLSTAGIPDPDLVIRPSGEQRLSNFLLWQVAYSEFWVTPVCWPDFGRRELLAAIRDYQRRERRFGGLGRRD